MPAGADGNPDLSATARAYRGPVPHQPRLGEKPCSSVPRDRPSLLIFSLFGILAVELVLVRAGMDRTAVIRTTRINLWYSTAAVVLALGFARAVLADKDWDYYQHNLFFWTKIAIFLLVGLLSIPPTLAFLRWKRAQDAPPATEITCVRRFFLAEVALFARLPVFAAAMARGYGV